MKQPAPVPVSFNQALLFWLKLGFISFGGPAGQIAIMQRELVDRRRWISQARFNHALNYCMLLPGPEAQQLATYIGWLMHRSLGGVVAGVLFLLPSLFILIALSWVYVRFGQVPVIAALFYGVQCAVAAIVVHAVWRVASKVLKNPVKAPILCAVVAMSFIAIEFFNVAFPWIVLVAACIGWCGARWAPAQFSVLSGHGNSSTALQPALIDDNTPTPAHAVFSRQGLVRILAIGLVLWLLPMAILTITLGWQDTLTQMAWFFSKAAMVTFGGAYAVLPYVVQGAVEQHAWLTAPQMMAGLALGESTPGPLIMVVAFVGFLGGWAKAVLGANALFVGAALAATVATWFTFLPSFIFILAGGPLVEATHGKLGFTAPLAAITAAVVGVIASLAVLFIKHIAYTGKTTSAINTSFYGVDWVAVTLASLAALALFRYKMGVIPVLAISAAAGVLVRLVVMA